MSESVTNKDIFHVGRKALSSVEPLSRKKKGERWLHAVVLGLSEERLGGMQIEYPVGTSSAITKPKSLDFRHGGSNPAVIELVVRVHGNELYGSQNVGELMKLCKISSTKARRRILLLLDPSGQEPIEKSSLKASYEQIRSGRGNFPRETVAIAYVHPRSEYLFEWSPR
jgi:hypothetical protein